MSANARFHDGILEVVGSLDGLEPAGRTVRHIRARGLGPDSREGLRPLARFEHLSSVELERITRVDLSPLADFALRGLELRELDAIDLGPLAALDALVALSLSALRTCAIPTRLRLAPTLESIAISNDAPWGTGEPVAALLNAIDWAHLGRLRELFVRVGALRGLPPIEVDLGFVCELAQLEQLRMDFGVWHAGERPSPLEPPFDGLPRSLKRVSIDAWEPDVVRDALRRYIPDAEISVIARHAPRPQADRWAIDPPEPDDDTDDWSTYGSLREALRARDAALDVATEYEAADAAARELRAADPALLEQLEFDTENAGTGISARARADLERALRILGLR